MSSPRSAATSSTSGRRPGLLPDPSWSPGSRQLGDFTDVAKVRLNHRGLSWEVARVKSSSGLKRGPESDRGRSFGSGHLGGM